MRKLNVNNMSLAVDFPSGQISSLVLRDKERLAGAFPIFRLRVRDEAGEGYVFSAYDAGTCKETESGAEYSGFPYGIKVNIVLETVGESLKWSISASSDDSVFVEWVDFPLVKLPALSDNNSCGNGGKILFPYNEGVIISDANLRDSTVFGHQEPEYPSKGCYSMFPHMLSSQMMAYLWDECGIYFGIHDPSRAPKMIDFYPDSDGILMCVRLFAGCRFGDSFIADYPIVWTAIDGRWESAADIYRDWIESSLPEGMKKSKDNSSLPEWYTDLPLVVSYPVRGVHDTDVMNPNALFPYMNAVPMLDSIKSATDARLLVLLMHWEGSAPWAPPYVWEPYGGEACFNEFMNKLHSDGDMLGVYCSGFGYTMQSNLVEEYNKNDEYEREGLERGMCVGPDLKVHISNICTAQRSGYDICPASEIGRELLFKAYTPLFKSGVDYAQILDQNHGGAQYFCYSREHGHPFAPGAWMTANMQKMLGEWNKLAPNMLFGCESAAAEPFIPNLLMSDNRFELNYIYGKPVPLYAYVYHEYLRNFMGNQVCCPFGAAEDSLCYRMAYSFAAGDLMTLVMTPSGDIMNCWGTREFDNPPSKEKVYTLVRNLTRFYNNVAKEYLSSGRMARMANLECDTITYHQQNRPACVTLPKIIATAWERADGGTAHVLVNPFNEPVCCKLGGKELTVPALDAILV